LNSTAIPLSTPHLWTREDVARFLGVSHLITARPLI
jgi:hypothetical protein